MEGKRVYFFGTVPKHCDVCEKEIEQDFADARLKCGAWAFVCLGCLQKHGRGLGTGLGQRYQKAPHGWLKIEG